MGGAKFCSLSKIARIAHSLLFSAQHGERESGCLRDQLARGPLDVRGVSLRPGSVPQPPSPRRDERHLRLPVLSQGVGGEAPTG